MLKLITSPNPVLKQQAVDWNFATDTNSRELEVDMVQTMIEHKGRGLAANQVGIRTRVFTLGDRKNFLFARAFFNPVIIAVTEETVDLEEGCLSFPGIFVNIKRPKKILARWQNSKGEWQQSEFSSSPQHDACATDQFNDSRLPQQKCKINVLALSTPELSMAQSITYRARCFILQIYKFK